MKAVRIVRGSRRRKILPWRIFSVPPRI